jgi:hypothetical protein
MSHSPRQNTFSSIIASHSGRNNHSVKDEENQLLHLIPFISSPLFYGVLQLHFSLTETISYLQEILNEDSKNTN